MQRLPCFQKERSVLDERMLLRRKAFHSIKVHNLFTWWASLSCLFLHFRFQKKQQQEENIKFWVVKEWYESYTKDLHILNLEIPILNDHPFRFPFYSVVFVGYQDSSFILLNDNKKILESKVATKYSTKINKFLLFYSHIFIVYFWYECNFSQLEKKSQIRIDVFNL